MVVVLGGGCGGGGGGGGRMQGVYFTGIFIIYGFFSAFSEDYVV